MGSVVAVEKGDGGPWMWGTMVGHGADYNKGKSNTVQVTETGHNISRINRYVMATPISAEKYLKEGDVQS